MTAFCHTCGTALPPMARFCSVCGTVVAGMPPAGYPPFAAAPPRLVRPIFGRQFAGVCVGMARTYGWDVGLVRVLTIIGAILIFPIVEVAYIACWIGIPEEHVVPAAPPPTQS